MDYYAGIDVFLELSSVCILDGSGQIVREARVASEPEALATFLASLNLPLTRVGLEAGPLSQWLHAGLVQAGFAVVLLETRHVKAVLSAMIVEAREDRRGDAARPRRAANGVRPVASGHAEHRPEERGPPAADDGTRGQRTHRRDVHLCRGRSRALRTIASRGAHFGLTPKKYQSGETDITGAVSRVGDPMVRTALYEGAYILLTRAVRFPELKRWSLEVAKRRGMRRAKVALARKLAVIPHRIWINGTTFRWGQEGAAA